MRSIPFALAGVLLAGAAVAQDAPPPAPNAPLGPAAAGADLPPPPPPGGPRGERPPPPSPGAAVMIDRGPNGIVRVDVHCARTDTTKDCADIARRLLAETSGK